MAIPLLFAFELISFRELPAPVTLLVALLLLCALDLTWLPVPEAGSIVAEA